MAVRGLYSFLVVVWASSFLVIGGAAVGGGAVGHSARRIKIGAGVGGYCECPAVLVSWVVPFYSCYLVLVDAVWKLCGLRVLCIPGIIYMYV